MKPLLALVASLFVLAPVGTSADGDGPQKGKASSTRDDNGEDTVFHRESGDRAIQKASAQARKNFRFFWREVTWENHRIVGLMGMASVKAPFSDQPGGYTENMWINEIVFDGQTITGTLVNNPRELTSVKEGDRVEIPLETISDWLYSYGDTTYGGYTVQVMRRGMKKGERDKHDELWGLDFGDPKEIRVCPGFGEKDAEGSRAYAPELEHPMSKSIGRKLGDALAENPAIIENVMEGDLPILHYHALAGSIVPVEALLAAGADPMVKTARGLNALQLAEEAGWPETAKVLKAAMAAKEKTK